MLEWLAPYLVLLPGLAFLGANLMTMMTMMMMMVMIKYPHAFLMTIVEECNDDKHCHHRGCHNLGRTQFTPSTNNISPANGLERSFAVFVILLAMGFFSSSLEIPR